MDDYRLKDPFVKAEFLCGLGKQKLWIVKKSPKKFQIMSEDTFKQLYVKQKSLESVRDTAIKATNKMLAAQVEVTKLKEENRKLESENSKIHRKATYGIASIWTVFAIVVAFELFVLYYVAAK